MYCTAQICSKTFDLYHCKQCNVVMSLSNPMSEVLSHLIHVLVTVIVVIPGLHLDQVKEPIIIIVGPFSSGVLLLYLVIK